MELKLNVERINVAKLKRFGEYPNFFVPNWLTTEVRLEIFTKAEELGRS